MIGLKIDDFKPYPNLLYGERLFEKSEELSKEDCDEILSSVSVSGQYQHDEVFWLDFSQSDFKQFEYESLARLVKWENELKDVGILKKIRIVLKSKEGHELDLSEASSGELTLLSMFTHLAINSVEGCVIIIDEPENSLHPQWQYKYVSRLLDLLNFKSPDIIVATHAPIVVSGARALASDSTTVYRAVNGVAKIVDDLEDSVEGTLAEVFETVTPKNHYVSRQLADGLGALVRGELSLEELNKTINAFEKHSYSSEQLEFLKGVHALANKVAEEVR